MRYTLNLHLIRELSSVLGIKVNELQKRSGLNRAAWDRLRAGEKELTMEELLTMCNNLRIPVHHFINVSESRALLSREDYVISRALYRECFYAFDDVHNVFGNGVGRLTWAKAAKVMGVTAQTMSTRFNPRDGRLSSLTVRFFLESCNNLGVNATALLRDPNGDIPNIVEESESFPVRHLSLMGNNPELVELRKRVERIEERMRLMEDVILDLRNQLGGPKGSKGNYSHASLDHDFRSGRLSYDYFENEQKASEEEPE